MSQSWATLDILRVHFWGVFGVIFGVHFGPCVTKLGYPRHFKGAFLGCILNMFLGGINTPIHAQKTDDKHDMHVRR